MKKTNERASLNSAAKQVMDNLYPLIETATKEYIFAANGKKFKNEKNIKNQLTK